tara:strand:+ start:15089 stop:16351 length:1263 start_codon:yes stop_codon:yes gene_type:complete
MPGLFSNFREGFVKNSFILSGGTLISQTLVILTLPIITRIYSPEYYGVYATFLAVIASFSSVAALRFDMAIMQARHNTEANYIFLISLIALIIFSSFSLLISFSINGFFGFNLPIHIPLLFGIGLIIVGLNQSFNIYFGRQEKFYLTSISKILTSTFMILFQIIISFLFDNSLVLILGFIFGNLIAFIYLSLNFNLNKKIKIFLFHSKLKMKHILRKYKDFPAYSSFGSLMDSLSLNLPIIYVAYFHSLEVAGIFGLAYRLINIPISFVGQSISQVFYRNTVDFENKIKSFELAVKLFFVLFIIFVPFLLIIFFLGERFFQIIFGDDWSSLGDITKYLIFAAFARFCVSPLSPILLSLGNIKLGVSWQMIYLISLSTVLYFLSNSDFSLFIIIFTIHEIVLYFLYLIFILFGAIRLQRTM